MDERDRPPLRIDRVDSIAGRPRLVVAGELDVETADRIERAVSAAAGDGGVELDLHGVTFIDSTGLNALLAGLRAPERVDVVVVQASPQVRRVMEISGLGHWLE